MGVIVPAPVQFQEGQRKKEGAWGLGTARNTDTVRLRVAAWYPHSSETFSIPKASVHTVDSVVSLSHAHPARHRLCGTRDGSRGHACLAQASVLPLSDIPSLKASYLTSEVPLLVSLGLSQGTVSFERAPPPQPRPRPSLVDQSFSSVRTSFTESIASSSLPSLSCPSLSGVQS